MAPESVRAQVAESWFRSAAAGVHADTVDAPITLPGDALRDYRQAHPLAQVFPLLDDVLGQAARDCDAIMAVSDSAGQLLWVCGSPSLLRQAESIGFVEGSNWDERLAGTNAPGMALALDESVRVIGAEHFRHSMRRWSCAATPIHDPTSSSLLGVLDITGGDGVVMPQTMAMVRAAARMAEAELVRLRSILGEELLASRPYRLVAELTADWLAVEAHLAAGNVAAALRAYRGPLLPPSTAPGVVRIRQSVEASLRQAVLDSHEPDLMSTWTRSAWGVDDYGMWQAQLAALGAGSPLCPLATGQLARLDRDLGQPSQAVQPVQPVQPRHGVAAQPDLRSGGRRIR